MRDIGEGCEEVERQLVRWTDALMTRDFDVLEDVLARDFEFTAGPGFPGGRIDRASFIAMDRKIKSCSIRFLGIVARRMEDIITSLSYAEVAEEFEGDLGPDMPSAKELGDMMRGAHLGYGSSWRREPDGRWRCFSHHIFGRTNG